LPERGKIGSFTTTEETPMRPARLIIAAVAALPLAMPAFGATAAEAIGPNFLPDPIYDSPLFNFEGFYVGVQGGAGALPGPGFVGTAGVVAGANFAITDSILTGLEFQGEGVFNQTGYLGADLLLLAKAGGYITDQLMAYGAVGGGLVNNAGSYALGGGLEMPIWDHLSARGEILGTGTFGAMPNGAKGSIGLLWHMN
jgi:outer membrane immunogenic protein